MLDPERAVLVEVAMRSSGGTKSGPPVGGGAHEVEDRLLGRAVFQDGSGPSDVGVCARTSKGHAAAAPPSNCMNSRRLN